jgi:hypothetical protein
MVSLLRHSGKFAAARIAGLLPLVLIVAALSIPAHATQDPGRDGSIDWAAERQFWSFRIPTRQPRPEVTNRQWPQQPIDTFVLDRLEQNCISPSRAADKATLLRRVTFDLTGLPPTPDELSAYSADDAADATERLVDRLLASPRFGERLASLWLPLARYAEDQAHQVGDDTKFFYPNAHKYRAWVIAAFNRDMPYDRFISLQLAADKMDGVESDDLAALGFLGLGPKYYNRNRPDVMADEWEDRVDTVTRTMLGLTVACARCHDHKIEPITQQDYYAMAGVFASTKMVNRTADGRVEKSDTKADKADKVDPDTLHIVEDGDVQNLNVFLRGNTDQKGPLVERRFLRLLCGDGPVAFQEGSGRKELAAAISSAENPLTGRVLVNRVWAWLFGRPLVATPSNLGHSGQSPTHPELLDDLTARFIENGSSTKWLVRELVLSATYRQSSDIDTAKAGVDPANELYGRMNRRRLSVEQWRDAVLFVTDQLQQGGGKSQELTEPANLRRTVYARVSRLKLNDLLMQFDYPDANVHAEKRAVTTTPTQKLFMLNSPFVLAQATSLAERLTVRSDLRDESRVIAAYELLFSRPPNLDELRLGVEFLRKSTEPADSRWERYLQMLLVSNEMLFVD